MRANASAGCKPPMPPEPRGSVTVVVLAAGRGVRMNSRIPKVLHPVAGRPMLLWAMAAAHALDPERTLVVTNPAQDGVQAALNGQGKAVPQARHRGAGRSRSQVAAAPRARGQVVGLHADTPLLRKETLKTLVDRHRKS